MMMRRKLLGCVLCLLLCGCCHEIPTSDLAAFEPMARLSDLNGIFASISTAGDHACLWNSLTGQMDKSEIRLTVLNSSALQIERLADGGLVDRRVVPIRFVGGYARIGYPISQAVVAEAVLVTSVGCAQIALTLRPPDRALAVYTRAHVFATMDFIPVPADAVPEWAIFRRIDQAHPTAVRIQGEEKGSQL